jgi:predicted hydrocarbon binding protein
MPYEEYAPKRLFVYDYKPGGKLAHFMVQLSNATGMLAEVSLAIAKHNVGILSGFHDAPPLRGDATWSFFADFAEADIEPELLANEIQSIPEVRNVRWENSRNGLIVDTLHFPILLGTEKALIVRAVELSSLIDRINQLFGRQSPSANVLLRQIGQAAGEAAYESSKITLGAEFIQKNVEVTIAQFSALGWGIFKLQALDLPAKTAEVHLMDSFECAPNKGSGAHPRSQFIRGAISGWLTKLFGVRTEVIETSCLAKGDTACKFHAEPVKT